MTRPDLIYSSETFTNVTTGCKATEPALSINTTSFHLRQTFKVKKRRFIVCRHPNKSQKSNKINIKLHEK